MVITKGDVVDWLDRVACLIKSNKDYLTELDSAIGDADHGINMARGFGKLQEQLPAIAEAENSIGGVLHKTGMALLSTVGGASGALYGTFFMQAANSCKEKNELTPDDLILLLNTGIQGFVKRGRTELQDKTMYDVWGPALEKMKETYASSLDFEEALKQFLSAAEEGRDGTVPLIARKGRASYLKERSIGHQDPGATSSCLMVSALVETLKK